MAGITDSAFRLMNKLGGADLVYSEMAHVNAIYHGSKKTLGMLKASPFEFPYIVQLFGNDPKYFAEAAKIVSTQGVPVMRYEPFSDKQIRFINNLVPSSQFPVPSFKSFFKRFLNFQKKLITDNWALSTGYFRPSGLDINLGCPARKVCGHGSGAALWKDLKKVRVILEAVIANTKLPVSIKARTAVGEVTIFDLLDAIKDLPIKRVMIHGRSYKQGFSGKIDTATIKKAIKKYPQFEIWANGGIVDRKSALEVTKKTGCSNLGIARGTLGNPLLAGEIKNEFGISNVESGSKFKIQYSKFNIISFVVLAYIHAVLNHQSKGKHGIIEMRKHLAWYFKDFPGAKNYRKKLVRVKNIKDIEKILSEIVNKDFLS